jgi:glyoxylase-like metal-dependent hydrolase (beta-lactamase superfamily II)
LDETPIKRSLVEQCMQITPAVSTHELDWSYGDYVEPLSLHVVEADDATVLVGGGDESIEDGVLVLAREHDIDVVLIEHAHVDHYGAVPALRDALDVTVAAPADDTQTLRSIGIDPDVRLRDGEPRWGIEPIATPGPTPGNMAYRYGDCLMAGDTVVGSNSEFTAAQPWTGPLAIIEARFSDDDAQARQSISRLPTDVESILVSHGAHVLDAAATAIGTLRADL